MAWVFKSNGEPYTGETHELVGRTFTGKTRTAASMPLLFVEEAPKVVEEKKPRHSAAATRAAKFKKDSPDA
tara:strand:+ start:426 stop:638 length:213 start_codon:yes stop_codon:yes gene_type:complete